LVTVEPSSNDSTGLSKPALRTFFNIAAAWELSATEQMRVLGLKSAQALPSWEQGAVAAISQDTLQRISLVIGIYRALQILLPNPRAADAWVKKENAAPMFRGRPALDLMVTGDVDDLWAVRRYLDSQLG
jgi:hypothetical protein